MNISVSARVSAEEKEQIDAFCKERDIKISQLIRWALKDYMERAQSSQ